MLLISWYVHFASYFYINIYCSMGCYYILCHNTYAYSLLFYKVYIKRENAGSWDSGKEKEQILETYSAQLQKSWNFTDDVFQIYKKYWVQEPHQGGHTLPTRVGARPIPQGAPPYLVGPLVALRWSSSAIWSLSMEKNHKPSSRTKLRRHEEEPWRNQSRALAELFRRGNFPPGGVNHRHCHHQCSSHRERAISINIFINTISSQNPSSSLVSNSCLQVRVWC